MANILQILRSTVAGRRPTGRSVGEMWVNLADKVVGYINEAGVAVEIPTFPIGGIILWSGSASAIPAGWHLCDGQAGTPNLQDRFVVGAGPTYAVGVTGGAATVTLTAAQIPGHTHTFSGTTGGQSASHTHDYQVVYQLGNGALGVDGTAISGNTGKHLTPSGYSAIPATKTQFQSNDHQHGYNGTTAANVGGGGAHDNMPPYYALAYIQRVA